MAQPVNFNVKSFVLITGASRGIGSTIAIEVAKLLGRGSTILLVARSEKGLINTKNRIAELNNEVLVKTVCLDLTKPSLSELEGLFDVVDLNVELSAIFHNVGQLGTLDVTTELTDLQKWRDYFDLNVFSVSISNSVFVKKLSHVPRLAVVNVTSLVGRKPFVNMAMYGSGKAARDLIFGVLAVEEPKITVLSYSPGPVDTDMVDEIIGNAKNEELRANFVELKTNKTILAPAQTVGKMLDILQKGDFKSGDVIDYFDRI